MDTTQTDTSTTDTLATDTAQTGNTAETGTADPCVEPSLELGSGATAHSPLQPGDPVTLVHGPQGGWHVDVSAYVVGTGQTVSAQPILVRQSDGLLVAGDQLPSFFAMASAEPCGFSFWGLRAFVSTQGDPQAFVCSLDGEPLLLSVHLEDLASGLILDEQIEVVGAADPADDCL